MRFCLELGTVANANYKRANSDVRSRVTEWAATRNAGRVYGLFRASVFGTRSHESRRR